MTTDGKSEQVLVEIMEFRDGASYVEHRSVDPLRIHIKAGKQRFTIKLSGDCLTLTTRAGRVEIQPRASNMIEVREIS